MSETLTKSLLECTSISRTHRELCVVIPFADHTVVCYCGYVLS